MQYEEPHHFAYDILIGFRQMAEPAGFEVEIMPVNIQIQKDQHYDVFMLEHDYVGAFAIGFSLNDPWIRDFKTSHTPAVLFDNYMEALIMTRAWNLLSLILPGLDIGISPTSVAHLVLKFFKYDILPFYMLCTNMG